VESAANIGAAETRLDQGEVDVLVTGLGTTPSEDVRTLRRIRRRHPKTKVIVLAATHAPQTIVEALKEHAFSYFTKPFSQEEIHAMVERALAEPDWDDGIEVLSDKPDWISVRASCRQLTADRLLQFPDGLSVDLSDDDRRNTGTAFREILMNAIEHGGQFDPAKRVEITRVRTSDMLMYVVRDPGPGFDFANLPHAAISSPDDPVRHVAYRDQHGMRAGGFGLLVARGLVDELVHNARGNEAVLIKHLSAKTADTPDGIAA
jgi:anti-sigma regulatory factor (Ser/Thr protein kinase)/CheY-like chemotaxis protein